MNPFSATQLKGGYEIDVISYLKTVYADDVNHYGFKLWQPGTVRDNQLFMTKPLYIEWSYNGNSGKL